MNIRCRNAFDDVFQIYAGLLPGKPPDSNLSDSHNGQSMTDGAVLDFKQLETIRNHFLEVLMKMKHNDAIDKTRARLVNLTKSWMELGKNSGVRTNSSCLAEKKCMYSSCIYCFFSYQNQKALQRDSSQGPYVHAFNVLRVAFNDTNMSTDTSGFSAEAMIIDIRSFSSAYWEKQESARRALTGLEIFHRYPSLHPFLYSELKIATELLINGSSEHVGSNLAKAVHPSLCPMLILISRLKPSTIASESGDLLDPFLLNALY
ncbi:thyroid adenoma-associated protein [Tanacetum coccineum]